MWNNYKEFKATYKHYSTYTMVGETFCVMQSGFNEFISHSKMV